MQTLKYQSHMLTSGTFCHLSTCVLNCRGSLRLKSTDELSLHRCFRHLTYSRLDASSPGTSFYV